MTSGDQRDRRGARLVGLFDVGGPKLELPRRTAMLPVDGDEAPSADTLEPAPRGDRGIEPAPAVRSDSTALGGTIETVLGPLVVDELLGRGGAAIVARAHHERDGFEVAIKVFPARVQDRPEQSRRFARELAALERITHENIVRVHAGGVAPDGRPYLVMELIRGVSLRAVLDAGPVPLARAASIVKDLAGALAVAHDAGVLHRDLKPTNVMLTRVGGRELAKLVDFGCTRTVDPDEETRLTSPGGFLGTPAYAAPEQLRGDPDVDARADLYGLGAVLHELITGRRAFSGAPLELMEQKLAGAPADTPDAEGLGPLASALLAPSRDARPPTALDVFVTLTRIHRRLTRDGAPPIPDAATTPDEARRRAETAVLPHVPTQLAAKPVVLRDATSPGAVSTQLAEAAARANVSAPADGATRVTVSTQLAEAAARANVSTPADGATRVTVSTQLAELPAPIEGSTRTVAAPTRVVTPSAARRGGLGQALAIGGGFVVAGVVLAFVGLRALPTSPAPVVATDGAVSPAIVPRAALREAEVPVSPEGDGRAEPSDAADATARAAPIERPTTRDLRREPARAGTPARDDVHDAGRAEEAAAAAERDPPAQALDPGHLERRLATVERALVDGSSWMSAEDARALERRLLDLRAQLAKAPTDDTPRRALAAAIDALARDTARLATEP
ncbi:serine/threonine protein kinase [Myxococcota bacterium]|nr:serine/threonine protein kinase [Myxococcota bacterium]